MNEANKTQKIFRNRKRLGEHFLEAGLIDEKTLSNALEIQQIEKKKIGQILIDMGVADDVEIARALSRQVNIPFLRLDNIAIPKEIVSLIPPELAENYLLLPVKKTAKGLLVVMANPLDLYALDDVRFVVQMPVDIAIAPQGDILAAIERYYPKQDLKKDFDSESGIDENIEIIQQSEKDEEKDVQRLLDITELPPIVRFTNAMLADAIKLKASDVHIEPREASVIVRYRIDGIMRETMKTDKHVHASLVSRIKVISNMDISIRRKPQDGRTRVRYGKQYYDLRVSTIPTSYGEKVTIRILDQSRSGVLLKDLGFSEKDFKNLENAIKKNQGIVLVTGPTGSGKSSTLYACINKLNAPEVNIVTVEDPIEFDIKGINQVQINSPAGITFASGLRSILRQDPDIIMVGEIRDSETASIAFQAAQTGHLVLSSLHTNDAPSVVTRLMDLGIEAFFISASLVVVIGQRLVRKVCNECKVPEPLSRQIIQELQPYIDAGKDATFWKGAGCESCQYTGYSGRLGVFEVLKITPSLNEFIDTGVSPVALKRAAKKEGFHSMTIDGVRKALQGLTTIDEIFRVVPPEAKERTEKTMDQYLASDENETEDVFSDKPLTSISSTRPKKILVVDDNAVIRKLVCSFLESEDYIIVSAQDGFEALKLVFKEKPDLIITDFIMPKMDGVTLIKKLKSRLATRYIPIIMLTAKDEVESEVIGIDAGADDYLTKPVNRKRLMIRIERLLKKQQRNDV